MTQAEFTAFYPQFAGFTPAAVLTAFIQQANHRFSAFSAEDAEEARRLYVAHKLTLYASTAPQGAVQGSRSYADLAVSGQNRRVASKKVGEVSVAYAAGASASAASSDLADLAETAFGLQLLALIRLYAHTVYVP